MNGGACQSVGQVGQYVCLCLPGFTGNNCQNNINYCESEPCMNNGICAEKQGGFSCTCLPNYTGLRCENDLFNPCASNPCNNNGNTLF